MADTRSGKERNRRVSLPPRLAAVAEWTPPACRLADVGADHGYLSIALVQSGRCRSVIACDVAAGPLDNARRNIEAAGVRGIRLRLGDGLSAVAPGEVDCVAIAGMGGDLMARIIRDAGWLRSPDKRLVLQPMSAAEELRAYLYTAGFAIPRERAVLDRGRLYTVMEARFTGRQICGTDSSLTLPLQVGGPAFIGGLSRRGDALALRYIDRQLSRLERWAAAIAGVPRKADEYHRLLEIIEEIRSVRPSGSDCVPTQGLPQ